MNALFQIALVFLLVLLNAYFVASEFALVAVRKTRIDELVRRGNIPARALQKALKNLDRYISATQLGITITSLLLGWVGEPAFSHLFSVESPAIGFILAFGTITFLHIVLGEIVPKRLALQNSEKVALAIITPLRIFSKVFRPFIWFLNKSAHLFLILLGMSSPSGHQLVYSEEEIRMLLTQSALEGKIPPKEVEMVHKVFLLGDTPVNVVMIKRREILSFNINTTLEEVVAQIDESLHSRFPVYKGTIDSIVGFVHVKDIYNQVLRHGEDTKLSTLKIIRPIIKLTEIEKIDHVLSQMRKKRVHIAVVQNDKGKTVGIVTLEDIIESLVGEIEDEFE